MSTSNTISQAQLRALTGAGRPAGGGFQSMTSAEYRALLKGGGSKATTTPAKAKPKKSDKQDASDTLALQIHADGLTGWVREHHFMRPDRDFRFDHAKVDVPLPCGLWLAIEIEGYVGIRTAESGKLYTGGHQSPQGFKKDIVKYRHALMRGWLVHRVSTADVRAGRTVADIHALISGGPWA